MTVNPAIIVPAFARPASLHRLLDSLNAAQLPADVTLVISIDGSGPPETAAVAESFQFRAGRKEIVSRRENLGLRRHLMWCGDQTERFGAVVVLEDDLVVDRQFFGFAVACLDAYKSDASVAGVALYSPRYNEFARLPFEPCHSGTTTYFMQVPCSWGQGWTRSQWSEFRAWLAWNPEDPDERSMFVPSTVQDWPASSWKKHFARYLTAMDRYIVYPHVSYSTNFADPGGTHIPDGSSIYQVPMPSPERSPDRFIFDRFGPSSIQYDAFMEPDAPRLEDALSLEEGSLVVDLYAQKDDRLILSKDLCLTSRRTRRHLRRFTLARHPVELNFYDAEGSSPFFSLCRCEDVILNSRPSAYLFHQYFHYAPMVSIEFANGYWHEFLRRAPSALKRRVRRTRA